DFQRAAVIHLHLDRRDFRPGVAEGGTFRSISGEDSGVSAGLPPHLLVAALRNFLPRPPGEAMRKLEPQMEHPIVVTATDSDARFSAPAFTRRAGPVGKDHLSRCGDGTLRGGWKTDQSDSQKEQGD